MKFKPEKLTNKKGFALMMIVIASVAMLIVKMRFEVTMEGEIVDMIVFLPSIISLLIYLTILVARDESYNWENEYHIVLMENDTPVGIVRHEETAIEWCVFGNRDNDKRTPFVFCHYAKFNTGSIPKHTPTEVMK